MNIPRYIPEEDQLMQKLFRRYLKGESNMISELNNRFNQIDDILDKDERKNMAYRLHDILNMTLKAFDSKNQTKEQRITDGLYFLKRGEIFNNLFDDLEKKLSSSYSERC